METLIVRGAWPAMIAALALITYQAARGIQYWPALLLLGAAATIAIVTHDTPQERP